MYINTALSNKKHTGSHELLNFKESIKGYLIFMSLVLLFQNKSVNFNVILLIAIHIFTGTKIIRHLTCITMKNVIC